MSNLNLMDASNQWATRPADERFESLEDLYAFWKRVENGTKVVDVDPNTFHTEVLDREIVAVGRHAIPSKFSHTGFEHLASAVDFSARELRKLESTPTLVSNILNNRIAANRQSLDGWKLVLYQNGDVRARAVVSSKYGFISNSNLVNKLMDARDRGWRTPPARPAFGNQPGTRPATEADVLSDKGFGLSINVGDMIAPAGLYASWDDMFVFLVNEDRRLSNGLSRGVFIWNNLTKARRYEITTFYYNHVCGNHIVWGASDVKKNRVVHIGDRADVKAINLLNKVVAEASDTRTGEDERRVLAASHQLLGTSNDEVIDFVYTKKGWVSKSDAEAALANAEEHPEDHGSSDPKSVWGFVNGLTRVSQTKPFTDDRAALDLVAGKIIEMVF